MNPEPNKKSDDTDAAIDAANNSADIEAWHVVQQPEGNCEICNQSELSQVSETPQNWGPFTSRTKAIAKRVGLIRSGKCLPK